MVTRFACDCSQCEQTLKFRYSPHSVSWLGLLGQSAIDWGVYRQQKFISLSYGDQEVQDNSVPGQDPPPGLQTAAFFLCPHTVGEREKDLVSSFSYKDTNPIMDAPPSWSHRNLLIAAESLSLLVSSHWMLRLQHMNFGGTQIFSP